MNYSNMNSETTARRMFFFSLSCSLRLNSIDAFDICGEHEIYQVNCSCLNLLASISFIDFSNASCIRLYRSCVRLTAQRSQRMLMLHHFSILTIRGSKVISLYVTLLDVYLVHSLDRAAFCCVVNFIHFVRGFFL